MSDGCEEMINNDLQFINMCEVKDSVIIKSHKNRDFSNLMIVTTDNCVINNICALKRMFLFGYIYKSCK